METKGGAYSHEISWSFFVTPYTPRLSRLAPPLLQLPARGEFSEQSTPLTALTFVLCSLFCVLCTRVYFVLSESVAGSPSGYPPDIFSSESRGPVAIFQVFPPTDSFPFLCRCILHCWLATSTPFENTLAELTVPFLVSFRLRTCGVATFGASTGKFRPVTAAITTRSALLLANEGEVAELNNTLIPLSSRRRHESPAWQNLVWSYRLFQIKLASWQFPFQPPRPSIRTFINPYIFIFKFHLFVRM